MPNTPAKVFLSYAHEDERGKDTLIKHLSILKRQGVIEVWHDRLITAGSEWKGAIDTNLEQADIILLLVSADFLASDYCWDVEMTRALQRHEAGEARVIPVILRTVDWSRAPFGKLQAMPTDAKAADQWGNEDSAFADIAKGIRKAVEHRTLGDGANLKSTGNIKMAKSSPVKKKILAVFANPAETNALRLGEEDRTIRESIQLSEHRNAFIVEAVHAATVNDVARALLRAKPDIVHVSGHGNGSGLVLETPSGGIHVVPQKALSELLMEYAPPAGTLECVVLNACYSVAQGKFTSFGVENTIAMEGAIDDPAAIEFSRGFYDAVGAGLDYPRAYKEGCLRASLNTPEARWKVCLLKNGKVYAVNESTKIVDEAESSQATPPNGQDTLLGVAIDLSGSMKSNMPNRDSREISRFDAFQNSFERLISDAETRLRQEDGGSGIQQLRSFVYGFGLRIVPHADVLALLQVVSDSNFRSLAERVKQQVVSRERQKYAGYSELASLASHFLGQGTVRAIAGQAEERVREAVFDELRPVLESRLREAGDVTVNLADLSARWRSRDGSFKDAEPVLFGSTPMCAALREIRTRFAREIPKCVPGTVPVLFVLSDGDADDGNPGQLASAFKSMGVIVVSCYVSDRNVAAPRTIYGSPQPSWDRGAREMFELSSLLPSNSDFTSILLRKGWTIEPGAKLFVQANHSEIVEEFMSIVLGPLSGGSNHRLLPPGV